MLQNLNNNKFVFLAISLVASVFLPGVAQEDEQVWMKNWIELDSYYENPECLEELLLETKKIEQKITDKNRKLSTKHIFAPKLLGNLR